MEEVVNFEGVGVFGSNNGEMLRGGLVGGWGYRKLPVDINLSSDTPWVKSLIFSS